MTEVAELDLPVLDYDDPSLRGERFHEVMEELASRGWLASMPLGYVILEREAGEFFLRSKSFSFPGMKIAEVFGITEGPLYEEIRRNILHIDGDDHRRLRNLVNPAFTPRAVERYRPLMRRYLAELFDPLAPSGSLEFVGAIARRYPALVIAAVMGAPASAADRLHEWSFWIQRQFAGNLVEERERIERAIVEFHEFADALLRRRRETPSDDLISTLIAAEEDGDRLSDVECVNLVLNVLIGGVDTTQSQLAHAIRLFATHPGQWELLAERPELVPAAVDEVLRFEPITPFTARIALEDVEYRGVTFPEGTVILVSAFTGNREPSVYAEPWSFDITAERDRSKPLTFGAGIHFCLGSNLARAEMQEALAFLAPRMRGLRLDGEPAFDSVNGIYGLDALPVRFDPQP